VRSIYQEIKKIFYFPRNIRGSANAQHANENLFITVIRPVLVELVERFILCRIFYRKKKCI
jgi:hypothetical protein